MTGRTMGLTLTITALVPVVSGRAQDPRQYPPREHAAIQYAAPPSADPIARLGLQLQNGKLRLSFEQPQGYLRSLLAALNISPSSQTLVFSETSLQSALISPATPRAIYFNDTTAVGFVKGADTLEIATLDPTRGVYFYQLAQKSQPTPAFVRGMECLQCHLTAETRGVPGLVLGSMLPLSDSKFDYAQGWPTNHMTPIADRWGGWYVTGAQVPARHLGNVPVNHVPKSYVRAATAPRLTSGAGRFDTGPYLSPHSDVVALLVLDHQAHMTNLLIRLGWEARIADHDARAGRGGAFTPASVRDAARTLVDYLLFVDEAPLPSPVRGSTSFAADFAAKGPRDAKGRSLRDFDLTRRLFRHPCSYMIYSEAFDALPAVAKQAVYDRMWQIFSGKDRDKVYARLSFTERRAIVEILRATKKDLPAYFVETGVVSPA